MNYIRKCGNQNAGKAAIYKDFLGLRGKPYVVSWCFS